MVRTPAVGEDWREQGADRVTGDSFFLGFSLAAAGLSETVTTSISSTSTSSSRKTWDVTVNLFQIKNIKYSPDPESVEADLLPL